LIEFWTLSDCRLGDAELIVLEGASQDRTADIVRDYANKHGIVRLQEMRQNRGKGYWVRNGAINAQGRIIFLTAPTSRSDRVGCAANCRRHANLWRGRGWEGPSIFTLLLRMVLGLNFRDTQSGFKASRQNAARTVFSRQKIKPWGFDPKILFHAGFKVVELPVLWGYDTGTRINPVADGLRMVAETLCIGW
jgi:hypothetical protein